VSCGDANNGIMALVDVPKNRIYNHRLTIAFNGVNTLTAKYHPYRFAAKDDVAICEPREPRRLSTEVFIQLMLNRERWRYSYCRKCYMDKLKRFSIPLPVRDGQLDEDTMEAILAAHPYWQFINRDWKNTDFLKEPKSPTANASFRDMNG
jgi:type I restriction enzyme M protein